MTKKEAIYILRNAAWLGSNEERQKVEEAVEVVAKAIEALNHSEIPNSSDCIDRAEAQTAIQFAARRYTVAHEAHGAGKVVWSDNLISVTDAMNALREVSPAQPSLVKESRNLVKDLVKDDTISRKQAIDALDKRFDSVPMEQTTEILMLRKDLRELPSAQPEQTTDDCISRKAAIDALCAVCGKACDKSEFVYNAPQDEQVILCPEHYCLCSLPSAQSERQKGEWTKDCACEICGFKPWYERDIHTLSFCPNCGADMRGLE